MKPPDPTDETVPKDRYDEVMDRVFAATMARERSIEQERALSRELYQELRLHPAARQSLLVRNSARFRSRALCELLLQESHEEGFNDPAQAIDLSRLAVTLAETLSAESCGGGEAWNGLCARASAQLGNACRISADHRAAEQAFAEAKARCEPGGIGLLDTARVLDLEASLCRDQGRFGEAARLLDQVIRIYRRLGQRNLLGRALKQKAMACGEAGDLEGEMAYLRHALDLLDPNEEPRTFLAARHNLITALNQCGRSREAFSLLFHTRPLYLKLGDRMSLLRMRWLEGLVAQGLGRVEQAVAAFREVQESFLERGLDYDAGLAFLDLAGVLIQHARTAEVRRLAEELQVVFSSRDLPSEAGAALQFFCQAAQAEELRIDLVRSVSDFLKRARTNPGLRFVPTA